MLVSLLRFIFPNKDIGWKEIGEKFTRYTLFSLFGFKIYLHQLNAPAWHPECHTHPWDFLAILLWRGYLERIDGKDIRHRPGSILWRPAESLHNVITPYGTSWSVIFTGPKKRNWGFENCRIPA